MGEELETTYISIDRITAREWRPTWVRSDVYVNPVYHCYNDLYANDVTSINGMTEEQWKSYQNFLKREKKKEEKRQIVENFYALTKKLEQIYQNQNITPF